MSSCPCRNKMMTLATTTPLPPISRSRSVLLGMIYGVSVFVVLLQLLAFRGGALGYVLLLILHAAAFWLLVFQCGAMSRIGGWCTVGAAALVIGTIPYWPTLAVVSALIDENNYHFSSLTENLPIAVRVLYEVGLFPVVQFALMFVAMRISRRR